MIIRFEELQLKDRYKIMSCSIIPRPIAWIITENKRDKGINIAPFSYFTALSSEPPTLIVSIGHKKEGSPKDTLANILTTQKCTICSVIPQHLQQMHQSSQSLEYGRSEAKEFGIPTKQVVEDYPPMIVGSPTALFCSLYQTIDLKGSKTVPVILKIDKAYMDDTLINERFDIEFVPVGRVGKEYCICDKKIVP